MQFLILCFKIALRDLRGALGSFWILLAGVGLGVAAIAAVGSVAATVLDGVRAGARESIGGDVSLRLFHHAAGAAERDFLDASGIYSETAELRPLARPVDGTGRGVLVELKGVDATYPLYGRVELGGGLELAAALENRNGDWGAVVDGELEIGTGGRIRLGDIEVEIRDVIISEPDRAFRAFSLGPRVMISRDALELSGLARPGAQVYWYSRLRLNEGTDAQAWIADVERRFPDAGWRIVNADDGVPGVERSLHIGQVLLILVGLAVLLIGGVGVASAISAHMSRKNDTIAILKSLGASRHMVFTVYLVQVLAAALPAIGLGMALGALAPPMAARLAGDWLAIGEAGLFHPEPLLLAGVFGFLTALLFSLWPLGRATTLSPQQLLRQSIAPPHVRPGPKIFLTMAAIALFMLGILLATAEMPVLAGAFALTALLAVLLFYGLGRGLELAASRIRSIKGPILRLAVSNLHRPGAVTGPFVMALGLGLTLLVAVKTVEGNASRHLTGSLPQSAPGLIFINLPPGAGADFHSLVAGIEGVERVETAPFLHARLTHIDGRPLHQMKIPKDLAWVVRGDRGLSWSPEIGGSGRMEASIDAKVAGGLGLGIGDHVTLNVLGRSLEAEVTQLRQVDWTGLGLDFPIIISPPDPLPAHTEVAAVWAADHLWNEIERRAMLRFPEAPPVRVAPLLAYLNGIMGNVADALSLISVITVLAAGVVLAGGVAGGYRRRVREMLLLKVVGVRPRQLALAAVTEFAIIGLLAALPASILGTAAAFGLVRQAMPEHWSFLPLIPLSLSLATAAAMALVAFIVTRQGLAGPPARLLRQRYPAV